MRDALRAVAITPEGETVELHREARRHGARWLSSSDAPDLSVGDEVQVVFAVPRAQRFRFVRLSRNRQTAMLRVDPGT